MAWGCAQNYRCCSSQGALEMGLFFLAVLFLYSLQFSRSNQVSWCSSLVSSLVARKSCPENSNKNTIVFVRPICSNWISPNWCLCTKKATKNQWKTANKVTGKFTFWFLLQFQCGCQQRAQKGKEELRIGISFILAIFWVILVWTSLLGDQDPLLSSFHTTASFGQHVLSTGNAKWKDPWGVCMRCQQLFFPTDFFPNPQNSNKIPNIYSMQKLEAFELCRFRYPI